MGDARSGFSIMIRELILKNRTCRRFNQHKPVPLKLLRELVDLARLSPSSANLQPLKYILSAEPETNALIFEHLAWAGYLTDWPGPAEGERPAAYIIILADKNIKFPIDCDHGIAAQSITLGAAELGLSCCIISSVRRKELMNKMNIPDHLEILLVIALGECREKIHIEEVQTGGGIQYWRDQKGEHHVPKRSLQSIILKEFSAAARET